MDLSTLLTVASALLTPTTSDSQDHDRKRSGGKEKEAAAILLGSAMGFPTVAYFIEQVFSKRFLAELPKTKPECEVPVQQIAAYYLSTQNFMNNVRLSEACGIPLLGYCMMGLCSILNKALQREFRVEMEYTVAVTLAAGKNPSSDASLVAITTPPKPILLCEYKPTVDPRPASVFPRDLLEMLMQGYYCMAYCGITECLHCLTDLSVWHTFKLRRGTPGPGLIDIEWCKTFIYTGQESLPVCAPTEENLKDHYMFLVRVISLMV